MSGFFAELKRRNVVRMAGLYLVGAWLLVQVAGTVLPMFGAPNWIPRSIVILLALGFVPALVFSWVFEMTPEGLKRDEEVAPEQSIAPQTARRMDRTIMVVLALALAYFGFDKFVLAPTREAARADRPATLSEARQLVAKARQLFEQEDDSNRENLLLADELLVRAERLDPTDGEVWAAHAQLSGLFISLAYDNGNARHAAVRTQAERAMKLAPESVESGLARAWYLTSQTNTLAEGESVLADLIKRAPADWRPLRIMGHTVRRLGRFDEGLTWLDRAAAFPAGAAVAQMEKATVLFNAGRISEAEAAVKESLKVRPLGRALLLKVNGLTLWEGDLDAAKQTLEQMPSSLMLEDRGAFLAFRVWLWRREPAKCLAVLNGVSRDFLEDQYFQGPKAFLVAATHKLAGRPDAARPEWERALRLIEDRLRSNPTDARMLCEQALCLIELDKPAEAETALRACQQAGKCEIQMWPGGGVAGVLLKLGRLAAAMDEIAAQMANGIALFNSRAVLELNPDFDPLKSDPRFQQILAKAPGPIRPTASAAPPPQKSVAVLAFTNLSDDKTNEYFSDGISEELLNVLSKVPGLKVSARTSAFHFKGKDTPIPEIAQKLGVAYVIEGSVRKSGTKVRITAQLIKAEDGFHVWSDNFDRELKDIFAVQDEIAGLIAKNLSLKLAASSPPIAAEVNPEAYRLYLEGRQQWSMRTDEGMKRADKLFRQALEVDPNFARAYVGLADTVAVTGAFKEEDVDNNLRLETLKLVDRALQIDPNLAEAHASRGNILEAFGRRDESRAAFERSLALNPNYATAHQWYGRLLWARGDLNRADAELRRAEELDPIAPIMPGNYGLLLNTMRRYREALAAGNRAVAIQPGFPQGQLVRANALLGLGRKAEAAALYREIIANPEIGGILRRPWFLAANLALAGDPGTAQAKLAQLQREPKIEHFQIAYLLMALGRPEEALAELAKPREKARDPFYFFQPNWDSVRDDPRFLAVIAQDGLADGYRAAWRQIVESQAREAAGK